MFLLIFMYMNLMHANVHIICVHYTWQYIHVHVNKFDHKIKWFVFLILCMYNTVFKNTHLGLPRETFFGLINMTISHPGSSATGSWLNPSRLMMVTASWQVTDDWTVNGVLNFSTEIFKFHHLNVTCKYTVTVARHHVVFPQTA